MAHNLVMFMRKRKNNPSEATIMYSTTFHKYALTAAAALIVSGAVAPSSSNAELIILGQQPQSLPDRCPAQRELSNANPWSAAAEKYYGKGYAQTLADLSIALRQDDDVALLRIYESLQIGRTPDVLSNAANALMVAAQIRRDGKQLSSARELFERLYRDYRDGRDRATGQIYTPYRDIAISAQSKLAQIYLLQGAASRGADAVTLYNMARNAALDVQRAFAGHNIAALDSEELSISILKADSQIAFETKDATLAKSSIAHWYALKSAQTSGTERTPLSIALGDIGLALAEIAAPENRATLLTSIRQEAATNLAELSRPSSPNSFGSAIKIVNETMQGSWEQSAQDRCVMAAQLRAVIAQVDLLVAKDVGAREIARQQLLNADRMLSLLPPYRHSPNYQLKLARSYWEDPQGPSGNMSADLRTKAESALTEAARLQPFCFCAENDVKIRELQSLMK